MSSSDPSALFPFRDFETDPDALELAEELVRAGFIGKDVLDHLTSLQTQVPNSMKLRYLLTQLYEIKSILNNKQLFFKMVKVLVAFQSRTAINSSSDSDIPLSVEHIPKLAELLVDYAYEWRSIGTALKFRPQELKNIEACQSLHSIKGYLLRILEDWIQRKHKHTLAPTVNNLECVLNSQLVGLGVVATCELRTNIALEQSFTVRNPALPYYVESVVLTSNEHRCIAKHTSSENLNRLEAKENGSVLLEVQVTVDLVQLQRLNSAVEAVDTIKYQWLLNGRPICDEARHTGITTPVLCVSDVDIDMDGSKYSCQVVMKIYNDDDDDADDDDFRTSFDIKTRAVTLKVSCLLDRYTSSLTSMYSAQPEVPPDTWPPVSSTKHINLALIKPEWVNNCNTEFQRHTIRGDMDDILKKKEKIKYDEILRCLKSGVVLFIEGRPGSGKTTFVHKITQDLITAPNGAIRLVLLVSLRVLNDIKKPNLDLSDILKLFRELEVSSKVLEERKGKGVCFIFDGLDEFSPSDKRDSVVYKIINKKYLSQSSVIVASRPAAIASLRIRANKVIEVLGFPNQQIMEYFDHYPFSAGSKSVSSKSVDLKAYLQVHPNILHMCYLPIHTAMVAFLFEVTGEVPKTETEIYTHFTRFTLMRSLTKNRAVSVDNIDIDIHNLSGEEGVLFKQICRLALQKTIANKQVLHQDEVNSYFQTNKGSDVTLGLITVDRTAGLYGFKNIYTFLHLTFQEYLAAYHISTLSNEDQQELIQLHGDKNCMLVVWKFFCGLVKFDISDNKFNSLAQHSSLFLVQSAYESQQPIVCSFLLKLLQNTFEFEGQYLTTPDFTALGYAMANASDPLSLSLKYCNVSAEAIDAMLSECDEKKILLNTLRYYSEKIDGDCLQKILHGSRSLTLVDIASRETSTIANYTRCDFSINLTNLHIKNVLIGPSNLLQVLLNCCKELQELVLINSIRSTEVHLLNGVLEKCKKLKVLDISNNGLQKDAKLLAPGLGFCNNLETLIIRNNWINSTDVRIILGSLKNCKLKVSSNELVEGNATTMSTLIEGIEDCCNLHELRLLEKMKLRDGILFVSNSQNWHKLRSLELNSCIEDRTIGYISDALHHLTNLEVLRVLGAPSCKLSDYGAIDLARGLGKCANLKEFLIRHCKIGDEGAQALADALQHCKNICTLDMSYNIIGNSGAASIFTTAGCMVQLATLNLSGNSIDHQGVITIFNSLVNCTSLSTLNLNENRIGIVGTRAISYCLQFWPNLEVLGLCGNNQESNVGEEGAIALAENLFHCTQLTILNLSYNGIHEDAASSLVQGLAKCSNLTELFLEGNRISGDSESISILKSWKHLNHLS